jgi:multidrug efflux pump subunit AcrA (membrane-fusion protein)
VSSAAAGTSTTGSSGQIPVSVSQLDASGYVVARRKATVSSPLGGRVMEVLISEGLRVKAGDVLARLDDAPNRLQLVQAQAQLTSAQAQVRAAQVAFDNAAPIYQRMQRQSVAGFLSAQDLDVAKTTYDNAT